MVTAVPRIARARPALVTCGTCYLAEDASGRALGAGGWTRNPRRFERADIRHMVTDPAHLRRGIGRALLEHVVEQARRHGLGVFDCLATRTAVPFCRAMGFVELGAAEVSLGPGIAFPVVRMIRGGTWAGGAPALQCGWRGLGGGGAGPDDRSFGAAQRKKAGREARPTVHLCKGSGDHSRWPKSCSIMMNMLMKSR